MKAAAPSWWHRRAVRAAVVCLCLYTRASEAVAAEPSAKGITLQQTLEAAARGPELQTARARTHAGALEAAAAGGFPATEVGVGTNLRTAHGVLFASVPLPVFGTIGAERRVGERGYDVARAEQDEVQLEVRRRAHRAWVELARAEAAVELERDGAARAQRIAEASQKRFEAGDASEVEVLTAQAAVQAAQAELAASEQAATSASIELSAVLGLPPTRPLHAEGGLASARAPTPGPTGARQDVLVHPLLRTADAKVAAEGAQITAAERHMWPELSLQLEAGIDDPTLPGSDLRVAVGAQLPLGSRLGQAADAARARQSVARAERDSATRGLAALQQGAKQRLTAAAERLVRLRDQLLPLQRRVAELAAAAYAEGQQGMVAVLEAERALAEVRRSLLSAQADAALAQAELDWASGGGS